MHFITAKEKRKSNGQSFHANSWQEGGGCAEGRGAGPGWEHAWAAVLRPFQVEGQKGWCRDTGPLTCDHHPCALAIHHSSTIKPATNPSQ